MNEWRQVGNMPYVAVGKIVIKYYLIKVDLRTLHTCVHIHAKDNLSL